MSADSIYRATDCHAWRVVDVLGQGSFGAVYRGVNKKTGETVAVKSFKTSVHPEVQVQQLREFEILQQLSHPNIVKLLSIENKKCFCSTCLASNSETCGRPLGQVLVMEYCVFGSLHCILACPENSMGLSETEFILLLKNLRSALKYLHQKNVVHRDIKPPNIMKTVQSNGSVTYKLCDFGGAKMLVEGEQFTSLVGTEEYLHPDIFRRAKLNGSHKQFNSTTDLWSLGVTLYQSVTGELPFRVVGGRKNAAIMYAITAGKPRGAISGVQSQPNGKIEWKYCLPKLECRLSSFSGLRRPVVELLAGLMDCSQDASITSMEQFFTDAKSKILSKRKIIIFCPHICIPGTELSVFLAEEENFESFCKTTESQLWSEIRDTTRGYSPGKLPILFLDERGQKLTADNFSVAKLYSLSPDGVTPTVFAYFLCPDVVTRIRSLSSWEMKSLPKNVVFRDESDIGYDFGTAKTCSVVAPWILRDLEATRVFTKRLQDSVNILKLRIDVQANSLQSAFAKDKEVWILIERNLLLLEMLVNQSTVQTGGVFNGTVKHLISAKTDSAAEITSAMLQIESALAKWREAVNLCNKSLTTAEKEIANFSQTNCTTAQEDAEFMGQHIAVITEIAKLFCRDRELGIKPHHLEFGYHDVHRRQLRGQWDAILSKWWQNNGDANRYLKFAQQQLWPCLKQFEELLPLLAPPYLEQTIPSLHDKIEAFDGTLEEVLRNYEEYVSKMMERHGAAGPTAIAHANVSSRTIIEPVPKAKPTETRIETEVQLLTTGILTSSTTQLRNRVDEKRWLELLQNAHSLNEQVQQSLELSIQFHATVSQRT